jgi:hypothetical protein
MKSVPQDIFSSRIVAWTLLTLIYSLPLRAQSTYTGVFTLPTLERGAVAWFEDAEAID